MRLATRQGGHARHTLAGRRTLEHAPPGGAGRRPAGGGLRRGRTAAPAAARRRRASRRSRPRSRARTGPAPGAPACARRRAARLGGEQGQGRLRVAARREIRRPPCRASGGNALAAPGAARARASRCLRPGLRQRRKRFACQHEPPCLHKDRGTGRYTVLAAERAGHVHAPGPVGVARGCALLAGGAGERGRERGGVKLRALGQHQLARLAVREQRQRAGRQLARAARRRRQPHLAAGAPALGPRGACTQGPASPCCCSKQRPAMRRARPGGAGWRAPAEPLSPRPRTPWRRRQGGRAQRDG